MEMGNADDEDREGRLIKNTQPTASSTLLPSPLASAVSLVTRSSALYIRLGSFIGGIALDGARITTLTGLEVSRAIIESILSRAGRDVALRSRGELGRADAESLLEQSIAALHSTITHISFAAAAGFHVSSTALSSAGDLSQHLLATLDSILGSTDSSRAIASIITLIRREFDNPATGRHGEKVGVIDLLTGICGLALLQRWSRKLANMYAKEVDMEPVIWDVVILDDGRKADVVKTSRRSDIPYSDASNEFGITSPEEDASSFVAITGNDEILQAVQRQDDVLLDDPEDWSVTSLKEKIMQALPPDASVSISTETTTTKTITVDIVGALPPDLSPPEGVEIVEESSHHITNINADNKALTTDQKIAHLIPRYRIVYRTIQNKEHGTDITASGAENQHPSTVLDIPPVNLSLYNSDVGRKYHDTVDVTSGTEPTSGNVSGGGGMFILSPLSSPEPQEVHNQNKKVEAYFEKVHHSDDNNPKTAGGRSPAAPSANQKRARQPMSPASSISETESRLPRRTTINKSSPKRMNTDSSITPKKPAEKRAGVRNALRKGSGAALSNLWNKDHSPMEISSAMPKGTAPKPPFSVGRVSGAKLSPSSQLPVPQRTSSIVPTREAPRAPQRGNPNYFSSRDLGTIDSQDIPRSAPRANYYSVHEHKRNSLVSQTDTYSIHSGDTRPESPTTFKTHLRAQSNSIHAKSENTIESKVPRSPELGLRRTESHVPSIYTLKTNNSETSMVLAPYVNTGAYDDDEALRKLSRTGKVAGIFPHNHLIRNVTRFVRFSSASYGANFLRVMGITSDGGTHGLGIDSDHHYEHHSFSYHTQLPASSILLSSFVDPQGGTDSTGHTDTGVPMVHFISLDHDSKAVILTCRGTLGFEDVLADMTCDYDDLIIRDKTYKVHKGILASAVRLLTGYGSRVIATLAAALEEFPNYGLVMCGHSLGGGVASLLAIMISEPSDKSSAFVTSSTTHTEKMQFLITPSGTTGSAPSQVCLPSGRPIHVYAYGPPATISTSLRLSTRGLITTIINGQDIVPYLSLGILHDFQAIALAFKTDNTGAKGEVNSRIWNGVTNGLADKWYGRQGVGGSNEHDDQWAYSALKALRASMMNPKLVPPGEVFVVESMPVLQRDAFTPPAGEDRNLRRSLGRPATRAVLRYVRDVEKRFSELQFGGSMLLDHSPGRYEVSLAALGKGVVE